MSPFLKSAQSYARGRWCWDDTEFLREQYEDLNTPLPGENPVQWINRLAAQYDLTDPNKDGFVRNITAPPNWQNIFPELTMETPINALPAGTTVTVRDMSGEVVATWTVPGGPVDPGLEGINMTITAD